MTHSPSDIAAQLLIDLGLFTNPELDPIQAWPVYPSNEPERPDNILSIYDIETWDHGRTQPNGVMQGPHGVQFKLRAKTHLIGWTKVDTLCDRLQLRTGGCYNVDVTIDGTRYHIHSFCGISQVIPLGKESPTSTRRVFVINAGIVVDQCQ